MPGKNTHHVFDLRDHAQLKLIVEQADGIIHCAALHAPHVGIRSVQDFIDINVGMTELWLFRIYAEYTSYLVTALITVVIVLVVANPIVGG